MNVIESLNWRYATKEFDKTQKISKEDLDTIVESLRLSASSFGLQPWKFLVISNDQVKGALLEHSWGQKQVVDCSHLIVFCHPDNFGEKNVEAYIQDVAKSRGQSLEDLKGYEEMMKGFLSQMSEERKIEWMKDQLYIALGSLLTTCAFMKIDTCPMEGIVPAQYDEVLGLKDEGLKTAFVCPVGYRMDSDKYASAPKVRFSVDEVIKFI